MQSNDLKHEALIRRHRRLLGHEGFGVTELRVFDPAAMVSYADTEDDVVRLVKELSPKVSGLYIGVQPRPLRLFDMAANQWKTAVSKPEPNCASDSDIEFITACFFDIDVVSNKRTKGHPASDSELKKSLKAARMLSQKNGLASGFYFMTAVVIDPFLQIIVQAINSA